MLKRIQSVLTDAEVETIDRQWLEGISKNRHMSWTNQTCNLGIQLAYDCREMPFQTLQNLVAIWTIYEEAIETLQSCRKDTYTSCSSLGQTAILPADADQEAYRRAIYDCANFAELEGLLGLHDPSSKIHPRTFTPNSEDGRGFQLQAYAIDFTEHAGTLNADDLRWWVLFTARMIDFAQALTDANVTFNAHGDLHFADLLDLISFEVDGRDYYVKNLAKLAR